MLIWNGRQLFEHRTQNATIPTSMYHVRIHIGEWRYLLMRIESIAQSKVTVDPCQMPSFATVWYWKFGIIISGIANVPTEMEQMSIRLLDLVQDDSTCDWASERAFRIRKNCIFTNERKTATYSFDRDIRFYNHLIKISDLFERCRNIRRQFSFEIRKLLSHRAALSCASESNWNLKTLHIIQCGTGRNLFDSGIAVLPSDVCDTLFTYAHSYRMKMFSRWNWLNVAASRFRVDIDACNLC